MASKAGSQDLLRGLLFVFIGGSAVMMGRGYGIGSATAMGPGYFAVLVGGLLALLGVMDVAQGLRGQGRAMGRPHLWPMACLALGVVGFGLLIDEQGLLPALFVLVACSIAAGKKLRWLEAAAIFIVLACLSGSLYVFGLGLPLSYLLPH
jgi:hypothetical protein